MMEVMAEELERSGSVVTLIYRIAKTPGNVSKVWWRLNALFSSTIETSSIEGRLHMQVNSGMGLHFSLAHWNFRRVWQRALIGFDSYVCVGGSSHSAYPIVKCGLPFTLWVATLYKEDRSDRVKKMPVWRRAIEWICDSYAELQETRILAAASHVYALSRYTENQIKKQYRLHDNSLSVLNFPVDENRKIRQTQSNNATKLIFSGRFNDPRKNISLLIESVIELIEEGRNPSLFLTLIGDEPSRYVLSQIPTHLRHHFKIKGVVPRASLTEEYLSSDIFVIPSNQEGLCISALEAMAHGLPIISTNCGGPSDFVGRCGYLIPVGDVAEMKEKICLLSESTNLRQKLSRSALEVIRSDYSTVAFSHIVRSFI